MCAWSSTYGTNTCSHHAPDGTGYARMLTDRAAVDSQPRRRSRRPSATAAEPERGRDPDHLRDRPPDRQPERLERERAEPVVRAHARERLVRHVAHQRRFPHRVPEHHRHAAEQRAGGEDRHRRARGQNGERREEEPEGERCLQERAARSCAHGDDASDQAPTPSAASTMPHAAAPPSERSATTGPSRSTRPRACSRSPPRARTSRPTSASGTRPSLRAGRPGRSVAARGTRAGSRSSVRNTALSAKDAASTASAQPGPDDRRSARPRAPDPRSRRPTARSRARPLAACRSSRGTIAGNRPVAAGSKKPDAAPVAPASTASIQISADARDQQRRDHALGDEPDEVGGDHHAPAARPVRDHAADQQRRNHRQHPAGEHDARPRTPSRRARAPRRRARSATTGRPDATPPARRITGGNPAAAAPPSRPG